MIDLDELERMVAASNARITRDEMCLRDMEWVTEHVLSNILPALIERVRRAEKALRKTKRALTPFAERVFNDNGDLTISDTWMCDSDDFRRAYFEEKRIDAHFAVYEPAKEVET